MVVSILSEEVDPDFLSVLRETYLTGSVRCRWLRPPGHRAWAVPLVADFGGAVSIPRIYAEFARRGGVQESGAIKQVRRSRVGYLWSAGLWSARSGATS